MWSDETTDSSAELIGEWRHLARISTEEISPLAWLLMNMAQPDEKNAFYSDTAFACVRNGSEWGLVQLDGLHKTEDTAVLMLFPSNTALVNFIAMRYYHRMLHPLRETVYTF
jgi:hypothetical protein